MEILGIELFFLVSNVMMICNDGCISGAREWDGMYKKRGYFRLTTQGREGKGNDEMEVNEVKQQAR